VSWAQAKLLGPEDYPAAARAAGRRPALGTTRVAELYARYGEEKRRRRVLDLDDLLTRCAQLVEDDPAVAAAQRWRLRHLFVDEMQDVNPAQWRLLIAWLAERDDLFVVGDPDQAVYSWNGADPSLLHRLPTLLPSTEVLRLETNYRSSPQILAAAQAVLEDTPGFARTVGGSPRDAARSEGPTPEIKAFQDEQAEAIALARWLRIAHRPGRPWSHLAVLARSNARLLPLAEALRRAEIPFRLRPPGAGEDPNRAVVLRSLQQFPPQTSLRSALAELVTAPALAGNVDRAGHTTILQGLGAAADELALDEPDPTVGSFLSWLAATGDGGWDDAGNTDRVELATFHRAKGLEWPVVAVIGLEDGLVPIGYATTPEALAEERRLLYVAITRAEEELWCSWSANRTTGEGTTRSCQPSPYLEALQAANAHLQSAPDVRKSARRVAELRDRLFSVAV
jgi:DNA helicase-2/ATP-dependent DNA helicase PcrA